MKADFLIVAGSARFLAESAQESAYSCVAVDGFGDADLSVLDSRQACLQHDGFDAEVLSSCCDALLGRYSLSGAVVGPGLDNQSGFLEDLGRRLEFFGNTPAVFSRCADARSVRHLFHQLGIPCPALTTSAPFLHRSAGGCGGGHIRWADGETAGGEAYLPGTSVSHLFLADGEQVVSVGFNTQWCSVHDEDRPFCYGGAINRCLLDEAQKTQLEGNAAKLTRELSLVGLNSMDYIKTPRKLRCLEVNPRPSATMQLYPGLKLFEAHLKACRGQLPSAVSESTRPCAHAIIYAADDLSVQEVSSLPDEICDMPAADSGTVTFKAGTPICSVRLSAATAAETLGRLNQRIIELFDRIKLPVSPLRSQICFAEAV